MTLATPIRLRSLPVGLICGAVAATGVGLAASTPAQDRYMKVEDVKPGMKGYGLTVLSGTKPERFDVEIISTLTNFRPGQDLFLVKTPNPRLDVARTVAGMSGSPIFIDGKLIGAYAYGWFFNVEPIAGVTPIGNMLDDLARPVPKELLPVAGRSPLPGSEPARPKARTPRGAHLYQPGGSALAYDLRRHAAQVAGVAGPKLAAPAGSGLRAATTELMVGGLSAGALELTKELLEPAGLTPMQVGGGGRKAAPPSDGPNKYVDGGVITVQLVRGDISLSGLGTVTHVVGDKLVAFGHPMIGGGIGALPTALGQVHWILATQNRSFKLGEPTQPLGTLVNDRQASIVVDTTFDAPMFPAVVEVAGALVSPNTKTKWQMEVSGDPFFAPSFVAIALGSALETTTAERGEMTWRATSQLKIKGYGTLEFEDFGAAGNQPIGPSDVSRTDLVRAVGALLNNPWKVGEIESVKMTVKVAHAREVMYMRGATVLEREIDAGEPARIRLTLQPHLGEQLTRIIEVPIDAQLAGNDVRIQLQPGYTVERIVPAPESFGDLLQVLPKMSYAPETLIASYDLPDEATAAFEGQVASRLPQGAADTLRPTSSSVAPALYGAQSQTVIPLQGVIVGQDTVTVHVREVVR